MLRTQSVYSDGFPDVKRVVTTCTRLIPRDLAREVLRRAVANRRVFRAYTTDDAWDTRVVIIREARS